MRQGNRQYDRGNYMAIEMDVRIDTQFIDMGSEPFVIVKFCNRK